MIFPIRLSLGTEILVLRTDSKVSQFQNHIAGGSG